MEIDGEEKIGDQEREDSDDEEEEDEDEEGEGESNPARGTAVVDNPFLDSFYGLSAADPKERSQAAQLMLQHCLLGPTANAKDAAYAFRRLLNGLCSGRAAARQGNASALASFLKIAFQLEKMDEIRTEASTSNIPENTSNLMYVRDRLLAATDTKQIAGRKKGSEERDYQFGRLFGILGIVRSNLLVPSSDEEDSEVSEVVSAMISDLVDLFWLKKWMREPAAHGITTMLKLFSESDNDQSQKIARYLVEDVIVPRILMISSRDQKEHESHERQALLESYCAEQVGIAAYIQSRSHLGRFIFPS